MTLRNTYKSPNPALNVPRRPEPVATDMAYSNTPAVDDGSIKAQIFVGRKSLFADAYGCKTDKQFVGLLQENIQKWGAMDVLVSDSAQAEIGNVRGEGNSPNNGMDALVATEPDTTYAPFASIAIANKVRPAWDELGTVGGSVGNHFQDGIHVLECHIGITAFFNLDSLLVIAGAVFSGEQAEEWGEQAFSIRDGHGCMLQFANNGLEVTGGCILACQNLLDSLVNFLNLARG